LWHVLKINKRALCLDVTLSSLMRKTKRFNIISELSSLIIVYLPKFLIKRKMKKVLMIAAIALIAVACNKNQAAVKKLDGTWSATSYTYTEDGVTLDLLESGFITSVTYTFDNCKLKDDEFCNLTTTVVSSFGTVTEDDLYSVTNDGETLQTKDDASSTTVNSITIDELTNSTFRSSETDEDGNVSAFTMEKQ
tara:strand:+ start:1013 stop:1591 length:579 start_codon:yes stop_codon:yes gene_type:complete